MPNEEPYDPYRTGDLPAKTPTACCDFACGNGDENKAWDAFYANFSPGMRRIVKRIIVPRGLPAEDANDIVMLAAERFIGNGKVRRNVPKGRLTPLVCSVTRHAAFDYLRAHGPVRERRLLEGADRADSVTQERERMPERISAMDFILSNALRPDFPNGEYCEEYPCEMLAVFECIRDDRAKLREIASAANVRLWKAGQLRNRAWARLLKDGEALLASLNLI